MPRTLGGTVSEASAGRLAAAGATLLLATAYVGTAVALHSFSPAAVALWRGLLSFLVLAIAVAVASGGSLRVPSVARLGRMLVLGVSGGLGLVVGMNLSIAWAGATAASFYVALASVMAAFGAPVAVGERLRRVALGGFGLAVIGTAALTGLGSPDAMSLAGGVAGILAAASFAVFLVLSRRWVDSYNLSAVGVSLAVTATTGFGLLAAFLVPGAASAWPAEPRPDAVVALVWLALVPGVAAQLLLVAAARRVPVTTSAALLLAKPVVAGVLAMALLGEVLRPVQLLGALLILAGIGLTEAPRLMTPARRLARPPRLPSPSAASETTSGKVYPRRNE